MSGYVTAHRAGTRTANRAHLTEPRLVRWGLTALALVFLALFLILPLLTVFLAYRAYIAELRR